MSALQFADDIVRDYLRYRGFPSSLKAFDTELKADKDKGFRPDRLVEHFSGCMESMDLAGLRDLWCHLDSHVFRRLEQTFLPTVRKLEMALLRLYVVTCIANGRQDKVTEFFDKMAPELHGQAEWKEWFAIPFLKGVEDNPTFQVFFTRHWQDMTMVSLRNFLSVVYQSMALPILLSYEEDLNRMQALQEENEAIKQQQPLEGREAEGPQEPMDDFYVIAQEPCIPEGRKIIPSFIRNLGGLPTSPILGRKVDCKRTEESVKRKQKQPTIVADTKSSQVESSSAETTTTTSDKLLLLNEEEYNEHQSCITHCKFDNSGMIASADVDGVIKVWSPLAKTLATVVSKSSITALEWVHKNLLMYGSKAGNLRLYDTKERRVLFDIVPESSSVLKEHSVACLACSPVEPVVVSALRWELQAAVPGRGKLLLWDLKSKQLQGQLKCESSINCCIYSRNGQLLLCGTAAGMVCLYDVRMHECVSSWAAHDGPVYSIQLNANEATCYTMGLDGNLAQWNVYKTGQKVSEFGLHPGCTGPPSFRPCGKLFSLSADGEHMLTCAPTSGIIYKVDAGGFSQVLNVGKHKSHVLTVDWSLAGNCSVCSTASADGSISLATLLKQ
uniref:WD repeat-containing protein 91 n=1 Tax=Ornithodoros turicata TaxID=34597 RepID=A0A2R5LLM7_9ACAR